MKLYRKLVALCLTAALAAGMAITASASASITVSVNGTVCDVSAYVNSDDRTMVPVEIADSLGLTYTVSGSSVTFTGNGVSLPLVTPPPLWWTARSMFPSITWPRSLAMLSLGMDPLIWLELPHWVLQRYHWISMISLLSKLAKSQTVLH